MLSGQRALHERIQSFQGLRSHVLGTPEKHCRALKGVLALESQTRFESRVRHFISGVTLGVYILETVVLDKWHLLQLLS